MKTFSQIILIFLSISLAQSQTSLKTYKTEVIVDTLLEKAKNSTNLDSAYYFAGKALTISKNQNFPEGIVKSYIGISSIDIKNTNYSSAILNASKANEIAASLKSSGSQIGIIYHLLSTGLEGLGAYKDAIDYRKRAINWQLTNNPEYSKSNNLFFAYNKIGTMFMNNEEYDSAKFYFRESIKNLIPTTYTRSLGSTFNNIGLVHYRRSEMDSAIHYFYLALDSYRKIEDKIDSDTFMIGIIKGNLASSFVENNPLIEPYFLEDINSSIVYGDFRNAIRSSIDLSKYLAKNKRYQNAIETLNQAERIAAENIHSDKNKILLELYEAGIQVYLSSGNIDKAKEYYNHYHSIINEINSPNAIKELIESHSTFKLSQIENELKLEKVEREKKLAQISDLNKQNKLTKLTYGIYISIAVFISIVLILLILRIRSNSIRNAKEKELKNKLLKMELKFNLELLDQSSLSLARKKEFATELMNRIKNIRDIDSQSMNSIRFYIMNELEIDETILKKEEHSLDVGTKTIAQLQEKFPDLSDSDIQLLSFVKMKLTNKQIAEIKSISLPSVKIAKNRLRKKLNLPNGSNFLDDLNM
ncbi:MAG: hypothetical protein KDC84_02720 [Crocinitomicaceae bacterium]|nr:hypothetical protein [Crocinitomicaceae bacterium]